jgi:two-component system response regulator HydG
MAARCMAPTIPDPARFFEALVRDMDEACIVVGRDQRVMYMNRRAEQITGATAAQGIGKRCLDVFRCPACTLQCGLFDLGEVRDTYARILGAEGRSLVVRKNAVLMHDGDGAVLGAVETFHEVDDEREDRRRARVVDTFDEEPLRGFVGRSAALRRIVDTIRRLSGSDATVLITGESGTGKELVARAVHATSRRRSRPFVALNCAALPADLVESELFGHVRGAFTGAVRDRKGAVESAEGGTFFLDEIGELPPSIQAKLLRLLQDKTFQRVGDPVTRTANVRFVSATNVDIARAVKEGRFRADLLYRLQVIPIHLPPLRDRREDISPLATWLLARRSVAAGRMPMRFSPDAMRRLERYAWPGNVRELINVVDYAIALTADSLVTSRDLPDSLSVKDTAPAAGATRTGRYTADDAGTADEARRIQSALEANGWHRQRTAEALGMDQVTLYRKMREHGIGVGTGQKPG